MVFSPARQAYCQSSHSATPPHQTPSLATPISPRPISPISLIGLIFLVTQWSTLPPDRRTANHRTPPVLHTKPRLSPHPKATSVFVRCCPLSSVVSGGTRVFSSARQAYCREPPSAPPPFSGIKKPRIVCEAIRGKKISGTVLLSHSQIYSTIAAGVLNHRVREGNGCFNSAMSTGK